MRENIKNMEVTTLEQLKEYSKGAVVSLPPFSQSQPFVARIKRPDVMSLLADGIIPNTLLLVAMELFTAEERKKKEEKDEVKDYEELKEVLEIIAKASLIEPTYEDIKNVGLELNMNQLVAIYNYTQMGVEDLKFFRSVEENRKPIDNGKDLSVQTK